MAKREKGLLPDFPLPGDPVEALENFSSMANRLQRTVDLIDGKLNVIDGTVTEIDKRFTSPTPPAELASEMKPKSGHLSYEGQSKVDYCLECCEKHGQTAKVLLREAIQRAEADSPSSPGVMEKVRGAVEELVGFEDDSDTVKNERVATLNSLSRTLRKFIYAKKAEIGGANLKDLREIKDMTDKLVDAVYQVRVNLEAPCIGCTVEELCGGSVECVEFVEKAIKNVKDPEEFKRILGEAREKYRR